MTVSTIDPVLPPTYLGGDQVGGQSLLRQTPEGSGAGLFARRRPDCLAQRLEQLRGFIPGQITATHVKPGQMVSILKYRDTTRYRYQTYKKKSIKVSTAWLIFNVIPGYRPALIHAFNFLKYSNIIAS